MGVANLGVLKLYQTSIGKKVVMAVTGLLWIGFVFFHMYGNLKVFGGAAYFNEYAEGLREVGHPIFGRLHLLTLARLGLIVTILLHIWSAWSLTQQSHAARPTAYLQTKRLATNYASLTIRWGGVAILLFLIFHLAQFTWGIPGIHPDFIPGDAYHNLVVGFQSYYYLTTVIYFLAVIALGLHLYHGTWSMFQTLGLNNKTYSQLIRLAATGLAIVVSVGFVIVPIAVILGIVS